MGDLCHCMPQKGRLETLNNNQQTDAEKASEEVKTLLTLRAKINSRLGQLSKQGKYTPQHADKSTAEEVRKILSQRNIRAEIDDPRWSNWPSFNRAVDAMNDKSLSPKATFRILKKFLYALAMREISISKVMDILDVMKRETNPSAWDMLLNDAKRLWEGEISADRW